MSSDVAGLAEGAEQPVLLTVNCLNGYFHFPYFDPLAEAFLKARGKGAVATIAPSGLSLNRPAHDDHRALLEALVSGEHGTLGEAVPAAQAAFGRETAHPELLGIHHLFGDPALALE